MLSVSGSLPTTSPQWMFVCRRFFSSYPIDDLNPSIFPYLVFLRITFPPVLSYHTYIPVFAQTWICDLFPFRLFFLSFYLLRFHFLDATTPLLFFQSKIQFFLI